LHVPNKGKTEFLVPDKAADEPEEGELPVDELKVLTGPCEQVPALQLLSNKPDKTKRFLTENSSNQCCGSGSISRYGLDPDFIRIQKRNMTLKHRKS
jgi:hypothetical protein